MAGAKALEKEIHMGTKSEKAKRLTFRQLEILRQASTFAETCQCDGEPRAVCAQLAERGFMKLLGWSGPTVQSPAVYEVTDAGRAYLDSF